jgi:MtN3 and saliva related transmembrane protein
LSETLALVTTLWGLFMGLAPLLQVRVILRERDHRGTSLGWVLILLVGFTLWFAYGVVNHLVPLMVTNLVSVTVTASLLVATRIYRAGAQDHAPSRPATHS